MTSSTPAPPPPPGPRRDRRRAVLVLIGAVVVVGLAGTAVVLSSLRGGGSTAADPAPTAGPPSSSAGTSSTGTSPTGDGTTRDCDAGDGDLRFDTGFTGADGENVPYSVSLPADYFTDCRDYPVLYVLHGRGNSNATFLPQAEELRQAVDAGVVEDVVIVTPDSNRDGRWQGRYDTAFIDELIPHVESTYRVRPGGSNRLLVGWSMGGHGAFRFGIEHPEDFAAVWAVDGAMSREPTDYLEFLDRVRADRPQITSVGGNLNGDRVEEVIDLFAEKGVEFPYQRLPLEHEFELFVAADRDAGWPTLRWMSEQLGRTT